MPMRRVGVRTKDEMVRERHRALSLWGDATLVLLAILIAFAALSDITGGRESALRLEWSLLAVAGTLLGVVTLHLLTRARRLILGTTSAVLLGTACMGVTAIPMPGTQPIAGPDSALLVAGMGFVVLTLILILVGWRIHPDT